MALSNQWVVPALPVPQSRPATAEKFFGALEPLQASDYGYWIGLDHPAAGLIRMLCQLKSERMKPSTNTLARRYSINRSCAVLELSKKG